MHLISTHVWGSRVYGCVVTTISVSRNTQYQPSIFQICHPVSSSRLFRQSMTVSHVDENTTHSWNSLWHSSCSVLRVWHGKKSRSSTRNRWKHCVMSWALCLTLFWTNTCGGLAHGPFLSFCKVTTTGSKTTVLKVTHGLVTRCTRKPEKKSCSEVGVTPLRNKEK